MNVKDSTRSIIRIVKSGLSDNEVATLINDMVSNIYSDGMKQGSAVAFRVINELSKDILEKGEQND